MVETKFQRSTESRQRADLYGLLGRLWLHEIGPTTCGILNREKSLDALQELGLATDMLENGQLESLAVDYCRTFIGPKGHVSPLQSVATDGLLNSSCVDSMRSYLEFVNVPKSQQQMLDHLGFQLQVMSSILGCEPTEDLVAAQMDLANRFFVAHIAWASNIFPLAMARAETDFYRSMIDLTDDFVKSESKQFENYPER